MVSSKVKARKVPKLAETPLASAPILAPQASTPDKKTTLASYSKTEGIKTRVRLNLSF